MRPLEALERRLLLSAPQFTGEVLLECAGEPIDVTDGCSAPYVVDFNMDGRRDLLVGQFADGKIRFYPNVGTDDAPLYDSWSYVQANGADLAGSYG